MEEQIDFQGNKNSKNGVNKKLLKAQVKVHVN